MTPPDVPSAPRHDAGTGDNCDCPSLPCVHRPRGSELASEYMDEGARIVAARIARAQPFAPGTVTGARQAWLREAIACAIEGKQAPPFVAPPPSPGGEDVGDDPAPAPGVMQPCGCYSTPCPHNPRGSEPASRYYDRLAREEVEMLRAQLAAASDRYARAVAEWDEVRGRLVALVAELEAAARATAKGE